LAICVQHRTSTRPWRLDLQRFELGRNGAQRRQSLAPGRFDLRKLARSSGARPRKRTESKEAIADRMVIMPPDRTAIAQENLQTFPIVHSFE
jgi:hypothetical protein